VFSHDTVPRYMQIATSSFKPSSIFKLCLPVRSPLCQGTYSLRPTINIKINCRANANYRTNIGRKRHGECCGACIKFHCRTNRRSSMTTDEDAFSCTTRFFLTFQRARWAIFKRSYNYNGIQNFRNVGAFASFCVT
jgi:hypothetical protein